MSGPTTTSLQSISYFSTDSCASKQSSMQLANTTQHSLVQFYRQTFINVKITITSHVCNYVVLFCHDDKMNFWLDNRYISILLLAVTTLQY